MLNWQFALNQNVRNDLLYKIPNLLLITRHYTNICKFPRLKFTVFFNFK